MSEQKKIITSCGPEDWSAVFHDYDGVEDAAPHMIGRGETEADAIADLRKQESDNQHIEQLDAELNRRAPEAGQPKTTMQRQIENAAMAEFAWTSADETQAQAEPITKEWCMKMAEVEGDQEISAGVLHVAQAEPVADMEIADLVDDTGASYRDYDFYIIPGSFNKLPPGKFKLYTHPQQPAESKLPPPELTWLYTHCKAIGMDCKSDSGKLEHDIALYTANMVAEIKQLKQPAEPQERIKQLEDCLRHIGMDLEMLGLNTDDVEAALDGKPLRAEPQEPVAWWNDRNRLGFMVRDIWMAWAREQQNPKPSWLVPYLELSEADKEVDRRIGEQLFKAGYMQTQRPAVPAGWKLEIINGNGGGPRGSSDLCFCVTSPSGASTTVSSYEGMSVYEVLKIFERDLAAAPGMGE